MNAFTQIATVLAQRGPWSMANPEQPEAKTMSKTDRMRHYLRTEGPANCHTLAMEGEVASTSLVFSLLKGDVAKGRVHFDGQRYSWNHEFDAQVHADIRNAMTLLKRHGYQVKKA